MGGAGAISSGQSTLAPNVPGRPMTRQAEPLGGACRALAPMIAAAAPRSRRGASSRPRWFRRCTTPGCSGCCCRARSAATSLPPPDLYRGRSRNSPRPTPAPPGAWRRCRSPAPSRPRSITTWRARFSQPTRARSLAVGPPQRVRQSGRRAGRLPRHRQLAIRQRQPARDLDGRALPGVRGRTARRGSTPTACRSIAR